MNTPFEYITAAVTILGGGYSLLRYITGQNNVMQKNFLTHLEKKNGHLERIANEFNTTVKGFNVAIEQNTRALNKLQNKLK